LVFPLALQWHQRISYWPYGKRCRMVVIPTFPHIYPAWVCTSSAFLPPELSC
jgi:hypothetical protein